MKKWNHAVLAMTAICVCLGIMIGIQITTVKKQLTTTDLQRVSELSVELKKASDENLRLSEKLAGYEKKVLEYEGSISNESKSLKLLQEELQNARTLAGMTDMTGRGITVTIKDSTMQAQNVDANAYLVHAEDILSVINELNVAGAEAVSINGQRIIGTSSVRCAGSVVNINGVKVAAPFVVTAIGDPEVLEAALRFPGGVVDSLSPWGIEITVKRQTGLVVPGYSLPIQFNEASPVLEKEETK